MLPFKVKVPLIVGVGDLEVPVRLPDYPVGEDKSALIRAYLLRGVEFGFYIKDSELGVAPLYLRGGEAIKVGG